MEKPRLHRSANNLPLNSNGHLLINRKKPQTVNVIQLAEEGDPDGIHNIFHPMILTCAVCGEYPTYTVKEDSVVADEPCKYPEGITTVVRLAVPSGRMVLDDDLRREYPWPAEGEVAYYNTTLGQAQTTEAMAAIGCAFGPMGNGCPGLYRTGPGEYVIATPATDDYGGNPSLPEADRLVGILADRWMYCIADYEDWVSRGGDYESSLNGGVIDIEPGVYEFTHHTGEKGFDHDAEELIYAHIKKVE